MGILLVGFWLLRQPYWVLLAVLLGVLDFIPIIGSGTVMVPWGIILLVLGNWQRGVAILAVWGIIC
ncbi:AI-2E family transporter, partial [Acinetobacter baumannii]|nr:AI-2E family transporter [Acinetobacter baumannii]